MNNTPLRDVLHLTNNEINAANEEYSNTIRNILNQLIQTYRAELGNHKTILEDLTQRTALLMTIAGLLSFLPSIGNYGQDYLHHFLIWTFPFLIGALCFYYPSSKRISTIIKSMSVVIDNSKEHIILMRNQGVALKTFWGKSLEIYDTSHRYYTYTSTSIYLYLISFTVNLYFFAFVGKPPLYISISMLIALLLIGAAKVVKTKEVSQKNVQFGESVELRK